MTDENEFTFGSEKYVHCTHSTGECVIDLEHVIGFHSHANPSGRQFTVTAILFNKGKQSHVRMETNISQKRAAFLVNLLSKCLIGYKKRGYGDEVLYASKSADNRGL